MRRTLRSPSAPPPSARQAASRAQALRQLELVVNRRLDGLLHGDHRGLIPGAGTEPGEGREYRVGDDVRRMDWNLTARTTVPHIREAIADRELETWIVVDQSASLDFGTATCEKRDLALAAAAAFAFLTARTGNRVGAVTLTGRAPTMRSPVAADEEEVRARASTRRSPVAADEEEGRARASTRRSPVASDEEEGRARASTRRSPVASDEEEGPGLQTVTVPARTGREAAFALLHRLDGAPRQEPESGPRPGLADLLVAAQRTARRRGLVAVISDFLDHGDWEIGLRGLAARHQVVAVEVRDPREDELPPVGFLTLLDPETGRRFEVQTGNPRVRRRFAEAAAAQREAIHRHVVAAGAAHLVLRTDRDWLSDIVRFVAQTRHRR